MRERDRPDVEITPQMVDTAVREIWGDEMLAVASIRRIAVRVYLAMERVRRTC
jgi:hypothetical protein